MAAATAPLVIAGAGLGDIAIVEAAAAVAAALGTRARLALFPGEADAMGLALLGAPGIDSAVAAAGSGAVLVLENDLFARCDPTTVEALFAGRTVIALDCLETATTARADIVLPVASFADAAGTFVNHEGRAQRFLAGRPEGMPAAWRMLAALGGGAEPDLDTLLAALARDCPSLAPVVDAAPPALFETPLGPVARAPARQSGRTASDRAGRIAEAMPPHDIDSPFGWTMEGAPQATLPMALFAGTSVLAGAAFPPPVDAPLPGDGLRLIPLHDPFSAGETDRASPLLAARAPAPRLRLHPDDAAALGLAEGDALRIDGHPAPALTLDAAVPPGHVALTTRHRTPRRVQLERRP
ncbi:molybdopterin-dependent oxidoreductase [Polymorphobacter sp.]|uniref:molybdopterin-dependent oxidoreductase n=1 Tax=Polymorphobacter sp. TaxID=1909290 RepID=UPI003F730736